MGLRKGSGRAGLEFTCKRRSDYLSRLRRSYLRRSLDSSPERFLLNGGRKVLPVESVKNGDHEFPVVYAGIRRENPHSRVRSHEHCSACDWHAARRLERPDRPQVRTGNLRRGVPHGRVRVGRSYGGDSLFGVDRHKRIMPGREPLRPTRKVDRRAWTPPAGSRSWPTGVRATGTYALGRRTVYQWR